MTACIGGSEERRKGRRFNAAHAGVGLRQLPEEEHRQAVDAVAHSAVAKMSGRRSERSASVGIAPEAVVPESQARIRADRNPEVPRDASDAQGDGPQPVMQPPLELEVGAPPGGDDGNFGQVKVQTGSARKYQEDIH